MLAGPALMKPCFLYANIILASLQRKV